MLSTVTGVRCAKFVGVPAWPLVALIATVPIHAVGPSIGFTLKPWILVTIAAVCLLARQLLEGLRRLHWSAQLGGALIVTGGLVGAIGGDHTAAGLRHVLAAGLMLAVVLVTSVSTPTHVAGMAIRAIAIGMGLASMVETGVMVTVPQADEILQVPGLVAPLVEEVYGDIPVARGLQIDSNLNSLYVGALLLLIPAFPLRRRRPVIDGLVVGLLLMSFLLGFSRSGWIALLVGGSTLFVVRLRTRILPSTWRAAAVAGLTVGVCLSLLLAVDATDGDLALYEGAVKKLEQMTTLGEELQTDEDRLAALNAQREAAGDQVGAGPTDVDPYSRWALWKAHGGDFWSHPLSGVGYGAGDREYGNYAHNSFLEAAAGGGALGLGGYVLLWGGAMAVGVRAVRRRHRFAGPVVAAMSAFLAGSMFLTTNFEPLGGLLVGLLIVAGRRAEQPESEVILDLADREIDLRDESGRPETVPAAARPQG